MAKDLANWAKKDGVKYFMVSFTDLFGGQRAKLVPAAGHAGHAGRWRRVCRLCHMARHDTRAPRHAGGAGPGLGDPAALETRRRLGRRQLRYGGRRRRPGPPKRAAAFGRRSAAEGMRVKTGIEAEFFLLTPDGSRISDEYDTAEKPCYDQQAVMRRYDVIAEICDYMLALGWGPVSERP